MNPFMVWSQYQRRIICEKTPDLHNTVISKQLGQKWRELSDDEKQPFVIEADKLRKLHSIEYPDYKYRPKKKQQGSKAAASTSLSSSSSSPTSSATVGTASGKISKTHLRETSKRKNSKNFKNDSNNNNNKNSSNHKVYNDTHNNSNIKTLDDISSSFNIQSYFYQNSPDSINNCGGNFGSDVCGGSTGTAEGDIFSDSELQSWTTTYPDTHFPEDDANGIGNIYCSTPTNFNEDNKSIIVNDPNMNPASPMFSDLSSYEINSQLQHQLHLQQQQQQSQQQQQQQQQQQSHQQQNNQHHHQLQHTEPPAIQIHEIFTQEKLPTMFANNNNNLNNNNSIDCGNSQIDTCNPNGPMALDLPIEEYSNDLSTIFQQLGGNGSNECMVNSPLLKYMGLCTDDDVSCGDDRMNGYIGGLNELSVRVTAFGDTTNSDLGSVDLNFVLNKIDSGSRDLGNTTGSHLEFKYDNKNLYNL